MKYFIPQDTAELLRKNSLESKNIDNFYLRLHRFTKRSSKDGEKYDFKIGEIKGSTNIEIQKIEKYYHSIKNIYPQSQSIIASNNWRLAIGIGNGSVYETSISLHHIYGVPYIPAQSIKGSFRSFIIEKYFENDEALAFDNIAFVNIFGSNESQGKVIFFDAFTKEPKLQIDIMNNHYQKYYNGKELPTDTQNPNPINFLTLKNSEFEVVIATKENIELDNKQFKGNLLDVVKSELSESLEIFGIGAKTAVGYGYFEVIKNEEDKTWERVKDTEDIKVVESFITRFSKSKYIDDANKKLEELKKKIEDDKREKEQEKFAKVNQNVKNAWSAVQNKKGKQKQYQKELKKFIDKWSKKQNSKGSELVLEYVEKAKDELKC
ncbi:MAG TPA: type III-B CRISPR module RAMP protein Cmr6 [Campylobacterales bacterium]|nr:type III-B CRISPR module RAMP protein Cmr6 [Campylobacterales bacterium]